MQPNVRALSRPELVAKLDDYLAHLRPQLDEDALPRAATAYLDEWASDDHGWLRKHYVAGDSSRLASADDPDLIVVSLGDRAGATLTS